MTRAWTSPADGPPTPSRSANCTSKGRSTFRSRVSAGMPRPTPPATPGSPGRLRALRGGVHGLAAPLDGEGEAGAGRVRPDDPLELLEGLDSLAVDGDDHVVRAQDLGGRDALGDLGHPHSAPADRHREAPRTGGRLCRGPAS